MYIMVLSVGLRYIIVLSSFVEDLLFEPTLCISEGYIVDRTILIAGFLASLES